MSIEVRQEIVYGLSNGENNFDLRELLKVKCQVQTLKTFKSNISKTVREWKKSVNRRF